MDILLVLAGISTIFLGIITLCQLASFYATYSMYKISKIPDQDLSELAEFAKEIMGQQRSKMMRTKTVETRPREEKKVR